MSTASWASDVYDFPPIDGMQTQTQPQYGQPQQQQFAGPGPPLAGSGFHGAQMFAPQQPTADIRGVGATFDQVRLPLPPGAHLLLCASCLNFECAEELSQRRETLIKLDDTGTGDISGDRDGTRFRAEYSPGRLGCAGTPQIPAPASLRR